MVKILIDSNTLVFLKENTFHYIENAKLIEMLSKYNLDIINYDKSIDGVTSYDLFMTMQYEYINNLILFRDNYLNKNIIYLGREDASNIYTPLLIKHPKIIMYLKDYTTDLMFMPLLDNMVQFYLCYPLEKGITYNNLNIYSLDKIKNCHWNIDQYSCCGSQYLDERCTNTFTNTNTSNNNQIIKWVDVSCCFHLRNNQYDGKHRMDLHTKLETLKNKYIIINRYDIPKSDYLDILKKSKIFISPYGMGERTASDYFAIYNDCILIKPFSKHIECDCDFFNTDYYINCKVDFSDLDMIIDDILLNYDVFYEKTQQAKKYLLSITSEKHVNKFLNVIASYDIVEKNHNHSFPYIMNEEYTLDMIYYTNVSNVLFDINDLEYIASNNNNTSNELLNILNYVNSNFMILIPNIYFNIEALNHTCLIENDNKNTFYEKYQIKYINSKNLFCNYDKIRYFSSFITKPHYYDHLFNIKYFRKISNIFYRKNILVITCFKSFFDSVLLDRCKNKTLFEIAKNFYENDYNNTIADIYNQIIDNDYDMVLVMLEKMSPLISSKLVSKIKVVDLGKTFGLFAHCSRMFADEQL